MKRYATTIVLVLVAIALGVGLWLDRDRLTEGERELRRNNVFVAWQRDALSRIEIVHEGETLVLERDPKADTAWRLVAPVNAPADQAAVERLVLSLEFATVLRKVSEGPGLGFEAPRATGRLVIGERTATFALGDPASRPEGASYLRVDGGGPVVVSSELANALLQSSDAYRDRSLVPYLSIELSRFEVSSPGEAGGGFSLERRGETSFDVASEGVRASREALDGVWGALAELRADRFVAADAPMGDVLLSFRMTPKDAAKPPAEFVATTGCPDLPDDVLLVRKTPSPLNACVPRAAVLGLRKTPAALVDTHLFSLRVDEIEELRLEWLAPVADAPPIEIARKGDGFHERFPSDRDLSPEEADAASTLLDRLVTSTADRVARGPAQGADAAAPAFTVRARVRSGDVEESVELAVARPGSSNLGPSNHGPSSLGSSNPGPSNLGPSPLVVRRVADGARLEVSPAVARRLLPRKTSLRPRVLLGETRRVTHVALHCGAAQELDDDGHGFRFVEPKGYEVDASLLDAVSALTRGRVEAWVADAPEPAFGLPAGDEGACRVSLGFEDGKSPVAIAFGAEGEGGVYGKRSDDPAVFLAPKSLRERIARLYVSRAYLRAPAEQIASVTATYAGKPLASASPSALVDLASSLYADRVVAIGPSKLAGRAPLLGLDVREKDGGSGAKIACARADAPAEWWCELAGVRATFAVAASKLDPLVAPPPVDAGSPPPEAGVARDPGAR